MLMVYTGGARSGKSHLAEQAACALGPRILYIATAVPFDGEMKERIAKHQSRRPSTWETAEQYRNVEKLLSPGYDGVLLDCVTILITNYMMDADLDWETADAAQIDGIEQEILAALDRFAKAATEAPYPVLVVTNELGMGLVPESRFSRIFRDIAGRANQLLARVACEVHFAVSGIDVRIK